MSRRWRRLYTWVTSLEFEYLPGNHCKCCRHMKGKFTRFKNIVRKTLQKCQSKTFSSFKLRLSIGMLSPHCETGEDHACRGHCFVNLKLVHVFSSISALLTRGVRQVELFIQARQLELDTLPKELFCCKSLEALKLNFDMNSSLKARKLFDLPKLKVLHLKYVDFPDVNFINNLFVSCPLLEDLVVESCCCDSKDISVSSPLLRSLVLDIDPDENTFPDPRDNVVLHTPNLQSLKYSDNLAKVYSSCNLDKLIEAHIRTSGRAETSDSDFESAVCLIKHLYNVQRLFLGLFFMLDVQRGKLMDKLPVFHNLKHLELDYMVDAPLEWHKVLPGLLHCSPSLERLSFPEGISWEGFVDDESRERDELEHQYWSSAHDNPPPCVRIQLKSILIENYYQAKPGLAMVKYFLKNSLALEELIITCVPDGHFGMTEADMISLQRSLNQSPKGSPTCSIVVQFCRPDE